MVSVGVECDDEGVLDLWIEWLREKYRQEYDEIMGKLRQIENSRN